MFVDVGDSKRLSVYMTLTCYILALHLRCFVHCVCVEGGGEGVEYVVTEIHIISYLVKYSLTVGMSTLESTCIW